MIEKGLSKKKRGEMEGSFTPERVNETMAGAKEEGRVGGPLRG